jgi:hypothetical protein
MAAFTEGGGVRGCHGHSRSRPGESTDAPTPPKVRGHVTGNDDVGSFLALVTRQNTAVHQYSELLKYRTPESSPMGAKRTSTACRCYLTSPTLAIRTSHRHSRKRQAFCGPLSPILPNESPDIQSTTNSSSPTVLLDSDDLSGSREIHRVSSCDERTFLHLLHRPLELFLPSIYMVEHLFIHERLHAKLQSLDDIDSLQWLECFHPFTAVKISTCL